MSVSILHSSYTFPRSGCIGTIVSQHCPLQLVCILLYPFSNHPSRDTQACGRHAKGIFVLLAKLPISGLSSISGNSQSRHGESSASENVWHFGGSYAGWWHLGASYVGSCAGFPASHTSRVSKIGQSHAEQGQPKFRTLAT